jgi:hypothetical protein
VTLPDTAATAHYLDASAEPHCTTVTPTSSGPLVTVANGDTIRPTKCATLHLSSQLSQKAQTAHVFDDLHSGSLLSIGQLCDDDCIALFTKYNVQIIKNDQVIIKGPRSPHNGLWTLPLSPNPTPTEPPTAARTQVANGVIRLEQTKQELALYYHGCAYSPVKSTFLEAIKQGHFQSWPECTSELIA